MKLLLPVILVFSLSAYADGHGEEPDTPPETTNDPIIETCRITAADIGRGQEAAKILEEQASVDRSASRPVVNRQLQTKRLEIWDLMRQNAEYYKNLDCHKHLYEGPDRQN